MISERLKQKSEIAAGYVAHLYGASKGTPGMTHGPVDGDLAASCERSIEKLDADRMAARAAVAA